MMAKNALILWVKIRPKRWDALSSKTKANSTQEAEVELKNTVVYGSAELLLAELIEEATEKLSQAMHDEAIRKVVSFKKKKKNLNWKQPPVHGLKPKSSFYIWPDTSRLSRTPSSRKEYSAKTSQTPNRYGRGKKFWDFSTSFLAASWRYSMLGQHWHPWQALREYDWMVEILRIGYLVPFHHLPPVSQELLRVPFLWLMVCKGWGTSGRSGQDARERCSADSRESGSGKLQSINLVQVTGGWRVNQEGECHVLNRSQRSLLSDSHPSEFLTVSLKRLE